MYVKERGVYLDNTAYIIVFAEYLLGSTIGSIFVDALVQKNVFMVLTQAFPAVPNQDSEWIYCFQYSLTQKVDELCTKYSHVKILFLNSTLCNTQVSEDFFRRLKEKGVSLNMLYLDFYDFKNLCGEANSLVDKGVFDKVFTFDPEDARVHGFEHCYTPYSKVLSISVPIEKDLYFIGNINNRVDALSDLIRAAEESDIRFRLDIRYSSSVKNPLEGTSGVNRIKRTIPYPKMLTIALQANCILDLTREGQRGLTLRPYEAVVYNRKLLTDNPSIFTFPYYDKRYMRYFSSVEEIDWDWVKEREPVDYGYRGDFSPRKFLEKLV